MKCPAKEDAPKSWEKSVFSIHVVLPFAQQQNGTVYACEGYPRGWPITGFKFFCDFFNQLLLKATVFNSNVIANSEGRKSRENNVIKFASLHAFSKV